MSAETAADELEAGAQAGAFVLGTQEERRKLRQRLSADLRIETTLVGHPMRFATAWGLFSPRRIDDGSRLLLDFLEMDEGASCLDLGCGYGALGLTMAAMAPQVRSVLVDKDFVAVDYARKNAVLNSLTNVEVVLSNGFNQIRDRRFDLIVSNLPAKVGRELLYLWLIDAWDQLNPGGRIQVVTITGLRRFIERGLREVFGNYEKVKQGRDYTVALARR